MFWKFSFAFIARISGAWALSWFKKSCSFEKKKKKGIEILKKPCQIKTPYWVFLLFPKT